MIKISKRMSASKGYMAIIRVTAVILALITTSVFLLIMKLNPLDVYFAMLKGAFGNVYKLQETIKIAIPLIILSLGIMIAFKMKFWNIGADGQMMVGAVFASYFALFHGNWPSYILIPIMLIAGIIGGGLWALIAAFFKVRFGTNETLLTLMLNYIAQKWITYLQFSVWKDPKSMGFPKIANFTDNAVIPKLFGIHIGWIIALLLVVIVYIFLRHTKKGYEITVIGDSPGTARYAGMNVNRIVLITLFLSGGICGLAGMIETSGVAQTLSVEITGGVGYTAIITAWLSNLSEPMLVVVAFLFAVLEQGAKYIQIVFKIPQAAAQVLQGMILFFVLGGEFFINYKLSIQKKEKIC